MARVLVASRDCLLLLHARGGGGASTEQREGGGTMATKEVGKKGRTERGGGGGTGRGRGRGGRWAGGKE
jgi:hypothetical protein